MAKLITIEAPKTYASKKGAVKAVEKIYADCDDLRYIIAQNDAGRYYPLFIGMNAIQAGVHFNFNVVA